MRLGAALTVLINIFLGLLGVFISVPVLAIGIWGIVGSLRLGLGVDKAAVLYIAVAAAYLVAVIGTLTRIRWGVRINLILSPLFFVWIIYMLLTPRMLVTEYNALSVFGRIGSRMPELLYCIAIFALFYYLPLWIISRKFIAHSIKRQES